MPLTAAEAVKLLVKPPLQIQVYDTIYYIPNIVEAAVPFFLASILIEFVFGWWKGKRLYRLNDTFADLLAGYFQLIVGRLINNFLAIVPYCYVFHNYRLVTLPDNRFHRFAHEMNFGWATHTVHHSSEDFNYAVALRQGVLQNCFSWISNIWLAFFFSPVMYAKHAQINLVYQFLIHTKAIGKLGFLETFMNTPSHHRVHHARNPQYLDKNYAGILIIFDKLFGTFEPEEETPVYGLVHPIESFDPITIQMHHWEDIAKAVVEQKDCMKKVMVVVRSPAWNPNDPNGGYYDCPKPDPIHTPVYDPVVAPKWVAYAMATLLSIVAVALPLLDLQVPLTHMQVFVKACYACWGICTVACIFNNRHVFKEKDKSGRSVSITLYFEMVRLGLTAAMPQLMITSGMPSEPFSGVIALINAILLAILIYLVYTASHDLSTPLHPSSSTSVNSSAVTKGGSAMPSGTGSYFVPDEKSWEQKM